MKSNGVPVPPEAENLVTLGFFKLDRAKEGRRSHGVWNKDARRWDIFVQPEALTDLTNDEQLAVVRHVIGHIVLRHYQEDCKEEDSRIAGDIAVNWWANEELMQSINSKIGGYLDPVEEQKKLGLPGETYVPYDVLHEMLHVAQEQSDGGGDGDGEGHGDTFCEGVEGPGSGDEGFAQALAATMAAEAAKNEETANQYGLEPGVQPGQNRLPPAPEPPPPWVKAIMKFSRSIVRTVQTERRTMKKPQPMLQAAGAYVPSVRPTYRTVPDTVCLLVDTSGSMWSMLPQVMPAVMWLVSQGLNVRLIAGDTHVTMDVELGKGSKIPDVVGGGGTEITPLFDRADDYKPRAIICFTDGYVPKWPKDNGVPTLWITDYHTIPYGTKAGVNDK